MIVPPSVPKPGDAFSYLFDHSRDTAKTENEVPTVVPADLPRIGTLCRDLPQFAEMEHFRLRVKTAICRVWDGHSSNLLKRRLLPAFFPVPA